MTERTCSACGKPLTSGGYSRCEDCRANDARLQALLAHYSSAHDAGTAYLRLFGSFSLWILSLVLWGAGLAGLKGLLGVDLSPWPPDTAVFADDGGIAPADGVKLALLLSFLVLTFVLFFGLRWGGTLWKVYPRPRDDGEGATCVTCGSRGLAGHDYRSARFGDVFICDRCVRARVRDLRLLLLVGGVLLLGLLSTLGFTLFDPNTGQSTAVIGDTIVTTRAPFLSGIAATPLGYLLGIVLVGAGAFALSVRAVLFQPVSDLEREQLGRQIANDGAPGG